MYFLDFLMPNLMQLVQLLKAWHDICNIKLI